MSTSHRQVVGTKKTRRGNERWVCANEVADGREWVCQKTPREMCYVRVRGGVKGVIFLRSMPARSSGSRGGPRRRPLGAAPAGGLDSYFANPSGERDEKKQQSVRRRGD